MAEENRYRDIIHRKRHVSSVRSGMSRADRAAQFSPFAALTGYEATIQETARLTDSMVELDESRKAVLNEKIQALAENLDTGPEVSIVYFEPDERKMGGAYIRVCGRVRKIDPYERKLIMSDRTAIFIDRIYEMEADFLQRFF